MLNQLNRFKRSSEAYLAAVIIILNLKLLFDTFAPASVLKMFYGHLGLPVPGS